MQQLVSVIIPTYKGADKINSAIDSVLNCRKNEKIRNI